MAQSADYKYMHQFLQAEKGSEHGFYRLLQIKIKKLGRWLNMETKQ